jgi:hypothetical protein
MKKSVPSSVLEPRMYGTFANRPRSKSVRGWSGRNPPSTTGPKSKFGTKLPGVPDCSRIASRAPAGCARRQASWSPDEAQPAHTVNLAATDTPSSAAVGRRVVQPPL